MITLRSLAIFSFSALLAGCFSPFEVKPPCLPPGAVQQHNGCYYVLEITEVVNSTTGVVRGKVPVEIVKKNEEKGGGWSLKWDWMGLRYLSDYTENYPYPVFTFPVQDFDPSKLTVKSVVEFCSVAATDKLRRRSGEETKCGVDLTQEEWLKL